MINFIKINNDSDIQKLAVLADKIWHEAFSGILTVEQINYMLEKFQSFEALKNVIEKKGYEYFFICDGDEIVGYTGLQETGGKLFLSKLYISKQSRGKKIASRTFDFIEEFAEKRNLKSIWLTVNRNNTHAIEVYKAEGFEVVREQKTDIGNGFVMDDFVFDKNL